MQAYRLYSLFGRKLLAVPAVSRGVRAAAWGRYQPFTYKRVVLRRFMQLAALLRVDRIFGSPTENPFGDEDSFDFLGWLEAVRKEINDQAQPVVIWPPQPDRARVYVHLLDNHGRPLAFVKASLDDIEDERLRTEAEVLRALNTRRLRTFHVPVLRHEGFWKNHRYIVQEALPTTALPLPTVPGRFPRDCIEELGGPVRLAKLEEVETFDWWRRFNRVAAESARGFLDELRGLIQNDGLPVRRVHGDIGSANLAMDNGRLWVMDWEESADTGPVLTDEIGYDLAAHTRMLRWRPQKELNRFSARYLRGASQERRRDVMAALAFRKLVDPSDASVYIRHWHLLTKA